MLPSVLMREEHHIINQCLCSTNDGKQVYTRTWKVEIGVVVLKICRGSLQDLKTMTFQQDSSEHGYSPDLSLRDQKDLGSRLIFTGKQYTPSVNIAPPRVKMRNVICRDSGTSTL